MTTPLDLGERVYHLPVGGDTILAIETPPVDRDLAFGLVLLAGGRYGTSAGRDGMFARLARTLATDGFRVVRLDYHGVGDSTGSIPGFRLDRPFVDEVAAIAALLAEQGSRRVVAIGDCFGARTALASLRHVDGVVGAVCAAMPVRDMRRGEASLERALDNQSTMGLLGGAWRRVGRLLRDPAARRTYLTAARVLVRNRFRKLARAGQEHPWLSPSVDEALQTATTAGKRLALVYGQDDRDLPDVTALVTGPWRRLFETPGSPAELIVVDGQIHGFTSVSSQTIYEGVVRDWLLSSFASDRSEESEDGSRVE